MEANGSSFQDKFEKFFGKVTDEQWKEYVSSVKQSAKMTHEIVVSLQRLNVQSKEVSDVH
jgi:hypothetical protein